MFVVKPRSRLVAGLFLCNISSIIFKKSFCSLEISPYIVVKEAMLLACKKKDMACRIEAAAEKINSLLLEAGFNVEDTYISWAYGTVFLWDRPSGKRVGELSPVHFYAEEQYVLPPNSPKLSGEAPQVRGLAYAFRRYARAFRAKLDPSHYYLDDLHVTRIKCGLGVLGGEFIELPIEELKGLNWTVLYK